MPVFLGQVGGQTPFVGFLAARCVSRAETTSDGAWHSISADGKGQRPPQRRTSLRASNPCLLSRLQRPRLISRRFRLAHRNSPPCEDRRRFIQDIDFAATFGEWCNGSTTDSDSVCLGSNPSSPAIFLLLPQERTVVGEQSRAVPSMDIQVAIRTANPSSACRRYQPFPSMRYRHRSQ